MQSGRKEGKPEERKEIVVASINQITKLLASVSDQERPIVLATLTELFVWDTAVVPQVPGIASVLDAYLHVDEEELVQRTQDGRYVLSKYIGISPVVLLAYVKEAGVRFQEAKTQLTRQAASTKTARWSSNEKKSYRNLDAEQALGLVRNAFARLDARTQQDIRRVLHVFVNRSPHSLLFADFPSNADEFTERLRTALELFVQGKGKAFFVLEDAVFLPDESHTLMAMAEFLNRIDNQIRKSEVKILSRARQMRS